MSDVTGVDQQTGALSRAQYDAVLDAAETYREALVVRLAGEVGLRPAEIVRLHPRDVERVRDDPPRYLLAVPAADGEGVDRIAYLPTGVERALRRYARSNGVDDDDHIVTVTPRRLQMLVSAVADRAADSRDDPSLEDVSTSDLRRSFAYRALVERGVNPRAVKAAGGWGSFEGLEPYLPAPTDDELVDAFEGVERPGRVVVGRGDSPSRTDDGVVRSLLAATDRCALLRLDENGYVERWNRSAATTFGYRAGEVVGTHLSAFYTDDDVDRGVPDRTLATAVEETGAEDSGWRVREDGSTFWAIETVTAIRDGRGRHRGYAVLVCDVSEFRERLDAVRSERDGLVDAVTTARRHRSLTEALLEASSHEAIETAVCRTLAAGETYDFAWIEQRSLAGQQDRGAASGVDRDVLDRLASTLDDADRERDVRSSPANERESTTALVVERDVEVDRAGTDDDGFDGSVAAVPLVCGETAYGTLRLAASRPRAFDDDECELLETIGRQVGHAIAAVRRRNLLLSDSLVELEFRCRDARSFFVDASNRLGCRFELDSLVPISESTQLYYVHLEGASPADVFDLADEDDGIDDCRLIETYETGWRVEFVVGGSSPTLTLTEYGATVVETVVDDGEETVTVECAADADLRRIVDGLRSAFPGSELLGKRDVERSVQTAREFREGLASRLTDRQEAALRAAYFGGYYDWPRESTAEEVADAMGISSPTLHNHLRKGQHELLRTFFDAPSADDGR